MRKLVFSVTLFISFFLTACTSIESLPGVYTLDIQQGNMVDQEMINQLRPNMTKRQVLYVMGSPMLIDVFHQKRWDYLYSMKKDDEPRQQKRISLFFEGDILAGIQGDFKPDLEAPKVSKDTIVDVPPRELDMTLWEKAVWLFSSEPDVIVSDKKTKTTEESEKKPRTSRKETSDDDTDNHPIVEDNIFDIGL